MPSTKIGYAILEDFHRTIEDVKVISENSDRVIGEACLQEAEEENRNGRCYLTQDLTREQNCARTKELLTTGYMLGEAGHPTDTSIIRQQTIAPNNVAVRYLKFWMDGPKWMAHFEGTNNALGEAVDKDLRRGFRPAFSMRALGTLENINGRNVVRDLRYITHDFVIYPSHPGAYTTKVVSENANSTNFSSSFKEYYETYNKGQKIVQEAKIIPIMNEEIVSYIKTESTNIKNILNQIEIFYESVTYDPKHNRAIMTTKAGDTFIVNCESYIKNEIEQYCDNLYAGII